MSDPFLIMSKLNHINNHRIIQMDEMQIIFRIQNHHVERGINLYQMTSCHNTTNMMKPCLCPAPFSAVWHCAHLVLKIFSPDLASPAGASLNVAIHQNPNTTFFFFSLL